MTLSSIKNNIKELHNKLGNTVTLVAVSKTKPKEAIEEAYGAGHRDFGENKVQELVDKAEDLPKDIRWHMIGHLQRNKVKYIAPFVHLIHGVDSERLLREINKQANKCGRIIHCLLQVHIASEDEKFGWSRDELIKFLQSGKLDELKGVEIHGLMGMATYTEDNALIASEFSELNKLYSFITTEFDQERLKMDTLSMGMSGDYGIAIEEGSNMVRIGTAIFGSRNW